MVGRVVPSAFATTPEGGTMLTVERSTPPSFALNVSVASNPITRLIRSGYSVAVSVDGPFGITCVMIGPSKATFAGEVLTNTRSHGVDLLQLATVDVHTVRHVPW